MIASSERALRFRPRFVLAHNDPGFAARARRQLNLEGYEVYLAHSSCEARRLARILDLPDESGWLTCNKMVHERPDLSVFLVATEVTPRDVSFADFVGATGLVRRQDIVMILRDDLKTRQECLAH